MLKRVFQSIASARRIAETSFFLQRKGWQWVAGHRPPVPELLRELVEDLGATYIKLGQLIASSPSLFPHEYVEAFQGCLDQTRPVPFKTLEATLRQDLGRDYRDYYDYIEDIPLASASIAQVHAARLKTGEHVVIKIQKPGVERVLETDFNFLLFATWLFERISPKSWDGSLSDIVREIRSGMLEECDFRKEAANISLYRDFLEQAQINRVRVPYVYEALSANKVITMERFYGTSLANLEGVKNLCDDPEAALVDTLNTWVASLLQCQIYHADLHAGNVMMLNNGQVGFIDFGIVGHIQEKTWQALLSLVSAVPEQNFTAIAEALANIGATKKAVNIDAFGRDLEALYHSLSDGGDALLADDFMREITLQLSNVGRNYGIRFPREFTLLIKQFLYFDRYIRMLAPELSLLDDERITLDAFALSDQSIATNY